MLIETLGLSPLLTASLGIKGGAKLEFQMEAAASFLNPQPENNYFFSLHHPQITNPPSTLRGVMSLNLTEDAGKFFTTQTEEGLNFLS